MIEIICQGKSPSEAKLKCMVAEILLTDENIPINTVIRILSIMGIGVRKHKADKEQKHDT